MSQPGGRIALRCRRSGVCGAWLVGVLALGILVAGETWAGSGAGVAETSASTAADVGQGAVALAGVGGALHGGSRVFFELLHEQPFVFLLLALAIGYPLGRANLAGVSLGPTAATLLTGVGVAIVAKLAFDITFAIPGIVSTIFLLLFMYALGLKVGPHFFVGLKSGGPAFIAMAVVVFVLNWGIAFGGAELAGLDPGFAAGIIAGSHTVTAVLGVASSAMQSEGWTSPPGTSTEQIGANIAAGYAITYIVSSIGTILLIRYLPKIFGRDPVADAVDAERLMSGGATEPLPGSAGSLTLGYSPLDIRAFRVELDEFVGRTVEELFRRHPRAPILRVVRGGEVIEPSENPVIRRGDVIAIRADVGEMILKGHATVGPEVDDPVARDIQLAAADLRIGSRELAGRTVEEMDREVGFGLQLRALFRNGRQLPLGPKTVIEFGDVARIVGPAWCIQRAAHAVGGRPVMETTVTEVTYLAVAMLVGYIAGLFTLTLGSVPIALGTSAGCLLAGIFVSFFRSRNPELGGPVSEGARSFLQDIGLNMFVAVLAANVGPKVIDVFQGATAIWVAAIGALAAWLPPFVAFVIGFKVFGLNSVVACGAATGARNSTPGLNAICEESRSAVAAVAYPVTYAFAMVLAVLGGYVAMLLSVGQG